MSRDGSAAHPAPPSPLAVVQAHGRDAVSFQSLENGLHWWHETIADSGARAWVAYADTGRAWIAVGTPLCDRDLMPIAVARFTATARSAGRRAIFFAVEDLSAFDGYRRMAIGLQSIVEAGQWPATLANSRKLREQLRRARAKGVVTRQVDASELAEGTPLRADVDRLAREWLASRHLEPMQFVVRVEPFHAPGEHVYLVAERHGVPVQFLSAVPIYTRNGWLFEDMLRGRGAPNGTTELLLDRLFAVIGAESWMTPGLTPLAGDVARWLRLVSRASAALYDFSGLERFRARLHPARWDRVWLTWDRGLALAVIVDVLRAFAGGRLWTFAARSLLRHPNGPPWLVAVPLVAWIVLLAALAASQQAWRLGFSTFALIGWVGFDAVLAFFLFEAARRPRPRRLLLLALTAGVDAAVSVLHLRQVGLGGDLFSLGLRLVATAGPVVGTTALVWAAHLSRNARRG